MIAAAVTPTDPVLSAPVLTGRLAHSAVPDDLRHGLTAESGINDGLALPLVVLLILLMQHSPLRAAEKWVFRVWLWKIGSAVAVGFAMGWFTCRCLGWSRGRPDAEPASLLTVSITLALSSLAGVRVPGGDGILAAFVAGAALTPGDAGQEIEAQHEHFNAALGRFFDLPVMILFGAIIPWGAWNGIGWRGILFAVAILVLRRLPAMLLLSRFIPWTRTFRGAVFAGWFGPIGAAAVFYAMVIQDRTGLATVWPAVSLAVAASVLVHGITATPFTWLFGRRWAPTLDRDVSGTAEPAVQD